MEISDLIRGLLEAYPDGAKVTLSVDIEPKKIEVLYEARTTREPKEVSPTTEEILNRVKAYEAKRLENEKAESGETDETQEPEPYEKKRPGKKATLDIDMGKVKALRAAGWSYAKIADEMRCSAQTIINKLKAEEAEIND